MLMPLSRATDTGRIVETRIVGIPLPDGEDRRQFAETLRERTRAPRGALAGMLLGAGLWSAILALAGSIRG